MTRRKAEVSEFLGEDVDILTNKSLKPTRRLLTPFLFSRVPPVPDSESRQSLPMYTKNILSGIFFTWLIPLFNVGYQRTLEFDDLWTLDERLSVKNTFPRFQRHLQLLSIRNNEKATGRISKRTLLEALFHTFKSECLLAFVAATFNYGSLVVIPVLIKKLIDVVELRVLITETPINAGVGYALGIVILLTLRSLAQNHALQFSKVIGAQMKTILTRMLMEKAFVASSESKLEFSNGKIFSLMSTDLSKIDEAISYFPFVVSCPFPLIAAIALLIVNIGYAALSGLGLFFAAIMVAALPTKALLEYKKKGSAYTDKRVELMREILNAMKMIKLHTWEDAYEEKVIEARTKESRYILKSDWLTSIMFGIVFNLSLLSSMMSFLVLYAIHSTKGSPGNIFASLSLFDILTNLFSEFPLYISYCTTGWVALTRVLEFLQSPDELKEDLGSAKIGETQKNVVVKACGADFEWGAARDDESKFCFKNVNLEISQGEFIVVAGRTGSGKSALLSAIAGGMKTTSGSVYISGSYLSCGQPWIQSATVRDNITFGMEFDPKFYIETIKACALDKDLESLSAGDKTEVGERGVTLSGGQKARINLARAVYARKDVYLLDDILSALDSQVGEMVVENCLTELMADKTIIMTTHQPSVIQRADRIVFIDDNREPHIGTLEEMVVKHPALASLMANRERRSPKADVVRKIHDKVGQNWDFENYEGEVDQLYHAEEKAVNSIPFWIYKQYLQAGSSGHPFLWLLAVIIATIVTVFSMMFANVWLSFWIDRHFAHKSDAFYIGIYVMFVILSLVLVSVELAIMAYLTINAAKHLNLNALRRVLHAPMTFTETTPSGRILNRFTKDTNSLDNEIGNQLKILIHQVAMVFGILILCVVYLPWFAIALPLLVIIFTVITNYYQASSREVKRLESVSRSFVYDNFNEVLNGVETIKAYNSEERFLQKNDHLVDRQNEAYLVTVANQRWIGISLDLTGCGLAFVVTMLALTHQFNISAASTGLIATYALELSSLFSSCLTSFSEVENEMNSVERLCRYANDLEQEAVYKMPVEVLPDRWSKDCSISFRDVSLRYRSGLPLALKHVNFLVNAQEKIGICGRTGSGKSSLIAAIFRLKELAEGAIEVGGVDVKSLGLHDLRSNLSIIPQDPVLLQGTIRKNLDPFGQYQDVQLWDAIKRSGLLDFNNSKNQKSADNFQKFHLDSIVEEDGSNFSLGERQLIALTRALVTDSKILIMDEATSNIDQKTDELVQKTIMSEFKDRTVLCIAHRLKTILAYDKVLVMKDGELHQYDEPIALFNTPGLFRDMCDSSDIRAEDFPN
ncbi:LAMI_0C05996g1_1 [Lachancea mirantina]|uniref:LAMI_0C05996g1_1 n=1 Tax=Lachancea mirantina TaxID=1230905 RepID=A0A1G4J2W7_9SACH|nr:LAMI_0C05996g1_1 [Lachancea mirantina]